MLGTRYGPVGKRFSLILGTRHLKKPANTLFVFFPFTVVNFILLLIHWQQLMAISGSGLLVLPGKQ